MNIYADTSFFVSLYLADRHSAGARKRLTPHNRLWLTPLHRSEWANAVSQHVFRHELTAHEAQSLYKEFERDERDGVWVTTALPEAIWESCAKLARKHTPRIGCRTLDILHVATAIELGSKQFWTFDERQERLAQAEGLIVV